MKQSRLKRGAEPTLKALENPCMSERSQYLHPQEPARLFGFLAIYSPVVPWLKDRLTWQEVSGSLGDLGTFLPLVTQLAVKNGMNIGVAFLFAGMYNIFTGLFWPIPMAVQPMKAIASVAATENLSVAEIVSAGMGVSAIVLGLGLTRLIIVLERIIPRPVIKGLQLGFGLKFMVQGYGYVTKLPWIGGKAGDCIVMAIGAVIFVAATEHYKRVPRALILFVWGLIMAIVALTKTPGVTVSFGISIPIVVPTIDEFNTGFYKASIPQIPLTILNSVIAVCALSRDLFPTVPAHTWELATAVGMMNLIGAWFGSVPYCHGAGGLAGQYKFGARTNVSILLLGLFKVLVAVIFGNTLMALMTVFPNSILGVLLAVSGIELASNARDQTSVTGMGIALVTAAGILSTLEAYQAVILGLGVALVLELSKRFAESTNPINTFTHLFVGPTGLLTVVGVYELLDRLHNRSRAPSPPTPIVDLSQDGLYPIDHALQSTALASDIVTSSLREDCEERCCPNCGTVVPPTDGLRKRTSKASLSTQQPLVEMRASGSDGSTASVVDIDQKGTCSAPRL